MAKKKEQKEDLKFIKWSEADSISGTVNSFLENKYGVALVIQTESGLQPVPIPHVLGNLLKVNLSKVKLNETEIEIINLGKPDGKEYYDFELYLDGEKMVSSNYIHNLDEIASKLGK